MGEGTIQYLLYFVPLGFNSHILDPRRTYSIFSFKTWIQRFHVIFFTALVVFTLSDLSELNNCLVSAVITATDIPSC